MAFVSLMLMWLAFFGLIIGFLFLAGMIFLITGLVIRQKPKYSRKKSPIVCIVIGVVFLILPVGMAVLIEINMIVSLFTGSSQSLRYGNVTDGWRSGKYIGDTHAREEAIEGLLGFADAGDRDSFEKMFTPRLQEREDFQAAVDDFFRTYPNGLSLCELEGGNGHTSGSSNYGESVQKTNAYYTCFLDGEWYYIGLDLCYRNTESPEEVGVTFFCIENLEANAIDREYGEDEFLACEIRDANDVCARLIKGRGYLFTPTPDRSITTAEMKTYLTQYANLGDLSDQIGEPNVTKPIFNSTGDDYYYELVPEDGEPRYAYICADPISGEIYYSYICSDLHEVQD